MPRIAIVTGASAGMGREFVRQLASAEEVESIWLVARRRERLEDLAAELEGVEAEAISLDLTERNAHQQLAERLAATPEAEVTWLVANAGFGLFGPFAELDLERQLAMIDLNCRALTACVGVALPFMGAGGRIVLVGSSAAFQPLPGLAVYAATKVYVAWFGLALRAELRRRDIGVTVVAPGPVATEFQEVAAVPDTFARERFMARPEAVVARALADARKGRAFSLYGASVKLLAALTPLVPKRAIARLVGAVTLR